MLVWSYHGGASGLYHGGGYVVVTVLVWSYHGGGSVSVVLPWWWLKWAD